MSSSDPVELVLGALDGVKKTGPERYMARCPAHDDRSPSLSVRFCDDGRTLVHCFGGCDIEAICEALGLKLRDLMPESTREHRYRPVRRTMPAREALQSLDLEALAVAIIAGDILEHREIDDATFTRLAKAVRRIGMARDTCVPARHRP